MSVMSMPRTTTVRSLAVERQVISCEGVVRKVVRIPDYQVKLAPDGAWHRRGAIETETACGCMIDNTTTLRAYKLDGAMCDQGCFSPHELRLGAAHAAARFDFSDIPDPDEP